MDLITWDDLKALTGRYPGWCVSILMPTHRAGQETQQDPIRLKNLVREVEERLKAKGVRSPEIAGLLEPAQLLLQDGGFWRLQSDGLALFLSPEASFVYRCPIRFQEWAVVADRFHIKPLLSLFTGNGHFYVLALSQNQVRLLEGTRHTVDEISLEGLPASLAEAFPGRDPQKRVQFHTGTSGGGGRRAAVFHGHDPSDESRGRILSYFRQIDRGLNEMLKGERSPLVLAGVDDMVPLYQEVNSYPTLLSGNVTGNPEELKPEELHARAWSIVQPYFRQAQQQAAARYQQEANTGQASNDVQEVVVAAGHGRVDQLFVATGVQCWGSVNQDEVELHSEAKAGDEDLLDLAAIRTILNGGTVYAVDPEQVPGQAPLAALFRY